LIGLLTALAPDGPKISTALVALIKGAHGVGVGVGVRVGSIVFNLASHDRGQRITGRQCVPPRDVLLFEGAAGGLVTLIAAGVLLGWLPAPVAVILIACVLIPYPLLWIHGPPRSVTGPLVPRVVGRFARAVADGQPAEHPSSQAPGPALHLLALMLLDVSLILGGSVGMVQTAPALSSPSSSSPRSWRVQAATVGTRLGGQDASPSTGVERMGAGACVCRVRRQNAQARPIA
jgi:hypothetical protein